MNKISFFGSIGRMWARILNYHDEADLREYWFPVIFHGGLCVLDCLMFFIADRAEATSVLLLLLAFIIGIYIAVSLVPGIALTVRRLHATGRKGWWTFLLLLVGIGTIWLMILCGRNLSDSNFFPWENVQENVYGPPEWFEDENEYKPENNQNEDVYGPPEWFEDENKNENEIEYNPDENLNVVVYGPPEWFGNEYEPEENINEGVYGPPEWFENENEYEPEENINEDVYGPPEWFE